MYLFNLNIIFLFLDKFVTVKELKIIISKLQKSKI